MTDIQRRLERILEIAKQGEACDVYADSLRTLAEMFAEVEKLANSCLLELKEEAT